MHKLDDIKVQVKDALAQDWFYRVAEISLDDNSDVVVTGHSEEPLKATVSKEGVINWQGKRADVSDTGEITTSTDMTHRPNDTFQQLHQLHLKRMIDGLYVGWWKSLIIGMCELYDSKDTDKMEGCGMYLKLVF